MREICWICKNLAGSREHMIKRSDLQRIFGSVRKGLPLHFYNKTGEPRFVQSLKSDTLKWPMNICGSCNSTLTQPYDSSWSVMSDRLHELCRAPGRPKRVSMAKLFRGPYRTHAINSQLYFIKHLGCAINHPIVSGLDHKTPADSRKTENLKSIQEVSDGFANSLIHSSGRTDIYLRFGYLNKIGSHKNVGSTDLGCVFDKMNGRLITLSIIQYLESFAVNVMYVRNGYSNPATKGAWNPLTAAQEIKFHAF